MAKLIATLRHGDLIEKWIAAEDLGAYPEALDALLAELPKANIDLTLFICKALAQIGDKKAIPALLDKWAQAPQGAPGTRYIPDVLAAIGDPTVVPTLVAPLKRMRFDYRLHIAYALGKLGGPLAMDALADMAANDPFPAVKEFAAEQLARLKAAKPGS
jgi:HEAT repeat protein